SVTSAFDKFARIFFSILPILVAEISIRQQMQGGSLSYSSLLVVIDGVVEIFNSFVKIVDNKVHNFAPANSFPIQLNFHIQLIHHGNIAPKLGKIEMPPSPEEMSFANDLIF